MAEKPPRDNNNNNGSGAEYSAGSIRVMEGLEAVRKRPGMYIGSTGPSGLHHLVYEVVDNSVDEALAGYCTEVNVTLDKEGFCTVEDNGRGIPTDIHPTEKISAAEVALTKLHAGGKFDKDSYKYSGGLHGVGISVVNALSEKLYLKIYRDGKIFEQEYAQGKSLGPLTVTGTTKKRGTVVRFKPDPLIFKETVDFDFDTLAARFKELAYLNKGLTITIEDSRTDKKESFLYKGGIVSFVEDVNAKKTPIFPEVIYLDKKAETYELEIALQYNEGYGEQIYSFVNNINTVDGGTHVAGFKGALTKVSNKRAHELNLLKEGESFSSEDVREGLVCVINMKIAEPQFEGQTKTKLGNSEVKGIVESATSTFLDTYFEENPAVARKVFQKAVVAMHAREAARKARDLTRRKTVMESTILPGKLADCTEEDPTKAEIFIVEGDSAGGSAKQGRDRATQAILPLKGKILNVEKARLEKILSNDEIKALIAAIGCGIGDEQAEIAFSVEKARYHKIILMTDADVDGSHIRALLLTFFFRYLRPIIEHGYLYIAQPPLYKAKIGKKEQYLKDDASFKQFLFDWAQEQTEISIDGKKIDQQNWKQLLADIRQYEFAIADIAHAYKLTPEQCHSLLNVIANTDATVLENHESLVEVLKKEFPQYKVELKLPDTASESSETERDVNVEPIVVFSYMNRSWHVRTRFFQDADVAQLLSATKKLLSLETSWQITIIDKDRTISGKGPLNVLKTISALSKPYMNIQRYKGLGEMNPEQLWETSMNAETRTLLQVNIEDGINAEKWFNDLMGDDVSARKQFIEENGQFVKNLDI
jgi:DNA gyrase subunit B